MRSRLLSPFLIVMNKKALKALDQAGNHAEKEFLDSFKKCLMQIGTSDIKTKNWC